MYKITLALVFGVFFLGSGQLKAQSIPCGEPYKVEPGDNLSRIAQRAYGNQGQAQYIFDVNWKVIGPNPSELQSGTELAIPCISAASQPPSEPPTGAVAEQAPADPLRRPGDVVALVTATDFQPFTDEKDQSGGMLTKIVKAATDQGVDGRKAHVYWVNDWNAHLKMLLLERNAFDAGFPWYQPDCEKPETLNEDGAFRCKYFRFSDPLYRVVVPFYGRSDSSLDPKSAADLKGRKICRPTGYFTFDLAEKGLIPLKADANSNLATLVRKPTPIDCFRALMDGEVDFVSINAVTAVTPIRELGIAQQIVERDQLSTVATLHVVVPKELPEGSVLLHEINTGLRKLRDSGEISAISRDYLERYHEDSR